MKQKVNAKFMNFLDCHDIQHIYGVPKFITVYLVKWHVFRIQRAPRNSLFAPTHLSSPPRIGSFSNQRGGSNKI